MLVGKMILSSANTQPRYVCEIRFLPPSLAGKLLAQVLAFFVGRLGASGRLGPNAVDQPPRRAASRASAVRILAIIKAPKLSRFPLRMEGINLRATMSSCNSAQCGGELPLEGPGQILRARA